MWYLNLETHLTGQLFSAQKQMWVDFVNRTDTTGNYGGKELPWGVCSDSMYPEAYVMVQTSICLMAVFRQMTGVCSFCNAPAQHVSCASIYREDRCLQILQCTSPTRILCQYLQRGQVSTDFAMHQPNTYPVPISTERTGVYSFCTGSCQQLGRRNSGH